MLLIVVCFTVCTSVFADETRLTCCGFCERPQPHDIRERTQPTQRTNDDRVREFFQSAHTQQVQQQREEDRLYRATHPRFSRYGFRSGVAGQRY